MRLINSRFAVSAILACAAWSCGNMAPRGTQPTSAPVKSGQWGGQHIAMTVGASRSDVEFDCGTATITGPLDADSAGAFSANGTFLPERPGPVTPDPPASRPMRLSGTVKGDQMQVKIALTDKNEDLGDFSLTLGGDARLVKCR